MTQRASNRSSSLWLLFSFGLAVGLHGVWFSMPFLERSETGLRTAPEVTALTRSLPGGWSPTLFSLPSVTGFSGAMKEDRFQTAPPLQSPLRLTDGISLSSESSQKNPQPQLLSAPGSSRVQRPLLSAPPTQKPERSGWVLDLPDAGSDAVRLSRLPRLSPEADSVDLSGTVIFDDGGRLVSLVIHPPFDSGDPGIREAIRTLRRLQADPSLEEESIRFRFSYTAGEQVP